MGHVWGIDLVLRKAKDPGGGVIVTFTRKARAWAHTFLLPLLGSKGNKRATCAVWSNMGPTTSHYARSLPINLQTLEFS